MQSINRGKPVNSQIEKVVELIIYRGLGSIISLNCSDARV